MLGFGPLTHQDRTGASFEMCDQSLLHGECAVAMTAGQTTLNHVMVRNEREGSSVDCLVFKCPINAFRPMVSRHKGHSNCLGASGIGPVGVRPSIC